VNGPARRELLRVGLSLAVVCAAGAAVLGTVYVGTERYRLQAAREAERSALVDLLGLGPTDRVLVVRQAYAPAERRVHYRAAAIEGGPTTHLAFALDGVLALREVIPAAAPGTPAGPDPGLVPLGRFFVGLRDGRPFAFTLEGEAPGYKARIRFLLALDDSFVVRGLRVIEHAEDPGLGAEVATSWFGGQFIGRSAADLESVELTKDPMPEDWSRTLARLERMPRAEWARAHGTLLARERSRPIHAVTGATISSRALTDGACATVAHFRRRWALLAPHLGGA
jgi:Na+-translocating ferredoxin:NAD+ oxidoreductase RnfG subunit